MNPLNTKIATFTLSLIPEKRFKRGLKEVKNGREISFPHFTPEICILKRKYFSQKNILRKISDRIAIFEFSTLTVLPKKRERRKNFGNKIFVHILCKNYPQWIKYRNENEGRKPVSFPFHTAFSIMKQKFTRLQKIFESALKWEEKSRKIS